MNDGVLYNEIDDFAADWLENLIRADLIAPGVVDRRSIVDLTPDDVARYRAGMVDGLEQSGPDAGMLHREDGRTADADKQQRHGFGDAGPRRWIEPAECGPTNGFWRDADWLFCRDGKWRPVESGTFPLVDGAPARVGRLRAYGNAVDAEATREFCEAVIGSIGG